jgi:hypothetical protein
MASNPHEPMAFLAPITAIESAAKRECQKLLLAGGEIKLLIGIYLL